MREYNTPKDQFQDFFLRVCYWKRDYAQQNFSDQFAVLGRVFRLLKNSVTGSSGTITHQIGPLGSQPIKKAGNILVRLDIPLSNGLN